MALILAGIAWLPACTSSQPPVKDATAPMPSSKQCTADLCEVGTDPKIFVYKKKESAPLVPINARLRWIDGESCLVVDLAGETAVPLWPEGSHSSRDADGKRGVEIPGLGRLRDGDEFSGKGVWHRQQGFLQPLARCGHHDGFITLDGTGIKRPG
jgi:hypothetical protein